MKFIEQHILVQKQARFYQNQEINPNIEHIWFALHGYGQTARSVMRKFEHFPKNHLIITPEALNRFYWQQFSGKVVASWMTSDDRLREIEDYVNYLNQLHQNITSQFSKPIPITVLGFSQGVSTACRWIASGICVPKKLILWAGTLPPDIDWVKTRSILQKMEVVLMVGKNDPFLNEERKEMWLNYLKEKEIEFELMEFEGGHEIDKVTLGEFIIK